MNRRRSDILLAELPRHGRGRRRANGLRPSDQALANESIDRAAPDALARLKAEIDRRKSGAGHAGMLAASRTRSVIITQMIS